MVYCYYLCINNLSATNDEAVRLDRDGRQVGSHTSAGIGGSVLVVDVTGQEVHDLQLVILAEMLRVVEILVVDTAFADEQHRTTLVDFIRSCASPGVALCIVEQNGAFGYSTSPTPTINSIKKIVSGTGEGNFTASISGLSYNTTYYYKAYVIQNGTPIYGSTISFNTGYTKAVVETGSSVSDIKYNSAKLSFTIKNVGDPKCTEAGICYGTSSNPTIYGDKVVGIIGTSLQKKDVSNLQENTTYYYRAYVMQNGEAMYGTTFSFKTASRPSVSTLSVSNLLNQYDLMNMWQVQLNGKVNSIGNPVINGRGFKYSTNGDPESGGTTVSASGSSAGNYSVSLSSLKSNTTYYVRAYVKNSLGYEYGELVTFRTGN